MSRRRPAATSIRWRASHHALSYAGSHDDMVEAMARIERWLK